jgi:NAD(P)-dependent dehydrogenase (short-subunit alcohol dehydrogenase family)
MPGQSVHSGGRKDQGGGWDQVLDINLKGVFLCCQAVGKRMIQQGGGKIINISSAAGILGEQGFLPYCVSKAGVMTLTRILAYEWSRYNILINAIAPGLVAGGMNTPVLSKEVLISGLKQQVPLKRLGRVEEIVNIAVFLASEDSSYINGTTIVADGGMTGYHPVGFLDLISEMMKKNLLILIFETGSLFSYHQIFLFISSFASKSAADPLKRMRPLSITWARCSISG